MTTTRLITINHHHDNPQLALLDTPPELATVMGRFQPARYVGLRSGSYVIANDQIPALTRFAAAQHITLIDGRRTTNTTTVGPPRPLPECSQCGAPASRTRQPDYCPDCGQPWQPVQPDTSAASRHETTTCTNCQHAQHAGFTYCGNCGTPTNEPTMTTADVQDALPLSSGQQP